MTVSVIIPTYNWAEALRLAITSVLAQTWREFELLVIGDACTDHSEEVVRSFGDSRIAWHNLPVRHKTQSGPNNHGIAIASGSVVAYLGHDDIWHPEHLASLVARMEETGAEMVCAVSAMYGPPGSGIRGLSGLFVEDRCRREDFVPPSALMHRRTLTGRIGPWGDPEQLAMPVDYDLLLRAFDAGVRMVSSERLTVFKFNSAWRRDSYLHRGVSEQQQMLARLMSDPARCAEQEWAALLRAMREKRLFETLGPNDPTIFPGQLHHLNLRNRGLAEAAAGELKQNTRFSLDDQASALEWYAVEHSEEWGSFRWSGPSPVSVVALPVRVPPLFRLRVQVLNWLQVDVAAELAIRVAGRPVAFTCQGDGRPAVSMEAEIASEEAQTGPLRIELAVARLRCPYFETGRSSPDQRWLGVCVAWIEVEPLQRP